MLVRRLVPWSDSLVRLRSHTSYVRVCSGHTAVGVWCLLSPLAKLQKPPQLLASGKLLSAAVAPKPTSNIISFLLSPGHTTIHTKA